LLLTFTARKDKVDRPGPKSNVQARQGIDQDLHSSLVEPASFRHQKLSLATSMRLSGNSIHLPF
jgi:hypothetical protein